MTEHLACQNCCAVGTEKSGQCQKCGYDKFEETLLAHIHRTLHGSDWRKIAKRLFRPVHKIVK